ncbi:MAG: hypothetical protein HY203_00340 [Nitrospirae bacterium]|nr:hypothetical protein [Nitrospirota bacterium]
MEMIVMMDSLNTKAANNNNGEQGLRLQWYRKQIELNPRGTEARYKLGVLLARLGRFEEAIVQLKNVIAIDSNHLAARGALREILPQMEARRKPVTSKQEAR